MSLKCSVLGHAFDDGAVEREREEQGSEVVSTIRETETCTRCGAERVVSENTEVTTLETPSDIVGEDLSGADTGGDEAPEAGTGEAGPGSPDPAGQGVAVGGPGSDTAEGSGVASTPPAETGAAGSDTAPSPATPETDVAADPDPDPEADDAVILGEEDETDERAPGEWPEEDDEDGDDWAPETDGKTPVEVERTSTAVTVPEGSFHCPECGFSTPVEGSSLRAGDFCPECHRGSLEHRR